MKHMLDMINQLIQKQITGFTMLHDAMLQYFLNLKPGSEDWTGFFDLIKDDESGDLLKNMAFTPNGARLACLLLQQRRAGPASRRRLADARGARRPRRGYPPAQCLASIAPNGVLTFHSLKVAGRVLGDASRKLRL